MTTHSPHVGLQVHAAPLSNGLGGHRGTAQWDLAHSFDSPLVKPGSSNPLFLGGLRLFSSGFSGVGMESGCLNVFIHLKCSSVCSMMLSQPGVWPLV